MKINQALLLRKFLNNKKHKQKLYNIVREQSPDTLTDEQIKDLIEQMVNIKIPS